MSNWLLSSSSSHSQILTFCGKGVKLEGKTLGRREAECRTPKSHIFPAQFPTIRPRQAGVFTWELFGTVVIVLSVPNSHKIQNYPLKDKPGWETATGGANQSWEKDGFVLVIFTQCPAASRTWLSWPFPCNIVTRISASLFFLPPFVTSWSTVTTKVDLKWGKSHQRSQALS